MNITLPPLPSVSTVTRSIAIIPELVRDTLGFARWDYGQLLSVLNLRDHHEHGVDDDEDFVPEPEDIPLLMHISGRIALELVMITRATRENHDKFHRMMNDVMPAIDSPQHAMDVVLSLAGMVAVLADEDDLSRFGETILQAEAMANE